MPITDVSPKAGKLTTSSRAPRSHFPYPAQHFPPTESGLLVWPEAHSLSTDSVPASSKFWKLPAGAPGRGPFIKHASGLGATPKGSNVHSRGDIGHSGVQAPVRIGSGTSTWVWVLGASSQLCVSMCGVYELVCSHPACACAILAHAHCPAFLCLLLSVHIWEVPCMLLPLACVHALACSCSCSCSPHMHECSSLHGTLISAGLFFLLLFCLGATPGGVHGFSWLCIPGITPGRL